VFLSFFKIKKYNIKLATINSPQKAGIQRINLTEIPFPKELTLSTGSRNQE